MLNNIYKIFYGFIFKHLIKKIIYKKLTFNIGIPDLHPKFKEINYSSKKKIKKFTFGKKNPDKNFFVIKKSPGAGFFSNMLYVLRSLEYSEKKKFISVVDMENFKNKYSEKKNLYNKKNFWEVCFNQISKYRLKEVYSSKNVFFSKDNMHIKLNDYKKKNIKKLFHKYISINKVILLKYKKFLKENFKNNKVLGFHLRGTDQKYSPGHQLPISIYKAIELINFHLNHLKFKKIFLVTEEKRYLNKIKSIYGDKIIYYQSFRANTPQEFNTSKRKFHRNKLAEESLIEALLLSNCNKIIYINSNIPLFSLMVSKKNIQKIVINNGIKSKNPLLSRYEFFIRVLIKDYTNYLFKKYIL